MSRIIATNINYFNYSLILNQQQALLSSKHTYTYINYV